MFGDRLVPEIVETSAVLGEEIQQAMKGDLSVATHMLTSHAFALDSLFTEMARRAGNNLGQYPDTAELYTRLALKAQGACRTTLEALAKLHQPREQTVKHVHVNNGGQAVVADTIHQHKGGSENGKLGEQSLATGTDGTNAALPSPNPLEEGVSITRSERQTAVPEARRD